MIVVHLYLDVIFPVGSRAMQSYARFNVQQQLHTALCMCMVQVVPTVINVLPIMQPFDMDNWKMSDSLVAAIGKPRIFNYHVLKFYI